MDCIFSKNDIYELWKQSLKTLFIKEWQSAGDLFKNIGMCTYTVLELC